MGTWEQGTFIQCGIRVTQQDNGAIELSFREACSKVAEIPLRKTYTTAQSQTLARAALGSLLFVASQG
eukprot:9257694-Alexandrium_andersonii.AAC.1